jgi:hypothetical protein
VHEMVECMLDLHLLLRDLLVVSMHALKCTRLEAMEVVVQPSHAVADLGTATPRANYVVAVGVAGDGGFAHFSHSAASAPHGGTELQVFAGHTHP